MKPKLHNRFLLALLPFAGFTLAIPSALAAPFYWDIDGATPGAGGATPGGAWSSGGSTWSTDATGAAATSAYTTLGTDDLFFSAGTDATGSYSIALTDAQNAGSLTFQDGTASVEGSGGVVTLAGAGGNITVDSLLSATVGNNTSTVIGGSVGLTKLGAGTLTLNGSAVNTFTGGLNVVAGALTLDFTNLATPTGLVDSANSLTLGGGTLTITGKDVAAATTSQTFAATTLGAGRSTLNIAKGALATSATLNLGALAVTPGSSTTILPTTTWATNMPSTTEIVNITSVNGNIPPVSGKVNVNAGLFYRQSASAGAARWVNMDSAGQLQAVPAGIPVLAATTADPLSAHQISTANVTLTNTAASSYGLVLNSNANPRTLTLAANGTFTINGIIGIQTTNGTTIAPGTGTSNLVIGSEKNLVINLDNSAPVTISAPIADNGGGASGVTIASTAPTGTTPGAVTFSGGNTYTGVTHVSNGTLTIANTTALGTTAGNTVVASGARVFAGASFASTTTAEPFTIAGAGIGGANGAINIGGSATGVGFSGAITLGADARIQGDGSTGTTFSGGIDVGAHTLTYSVGGGGTSTVNTSGISGSGGSLVKISTGTLNLNAENTYTGTTTISAGVLSLGNLGALQDTSGIAISGGGSLSSIINGMTIDAPITLGTTGTNSSIALGRNTGAQGSFTVNSPIGGAGNLIITTPAGANSGNNLQTINLGAANSYEGNTTFTTVTTGNTISVRALVDNVLPATTVLTIDGGNGSGSGRTVTFNLNGNDQTLAGLTNNTTRTDRNQRVTNSSATLSTLTINNNVDYAFGGAFTDGNAQITGNLELTKSGTGKFTLAAGVGNTFTGATTILGGILSVGHPTSLQSSPFDTLNSVAGDTTSGLQTTVTTLTLGGLTGDKNLASVFTTTAGGYDTVTTLTLNPGTGATHSYSGVIANGAAAMNLIKSGAGTQALTGTATYTGTTTVNNGTLLVNGALDAASAVTVNGGNLGGTGTVGGPVTVAAAGNLAPGASAGTLSIANTLDLSAMAGGAGKLKFELDTLAGPNDLIAVTGELTIGVGALGFNNFEFTNLGGLQTGSYTLVTSGGINGGDSLDPADLVGAVGGFIGTLGISGGNIVLSVTPGGYATWQSANGTIEAIDLDHDGDGVGNGIEYFLGGANSTTGSTSLPGVTNTGGTLSVTWTRSGSYTGTYGSDFVVETSSSLSGLWTTETLWGSVTITGNDVKYTFPAGTRNFARLKVTGP